ncbi:hypothetical protein PP707_08525 [Acetobacter pasteurianus]|nr:hypothetical protein [Acetobacter pasteurianus]
MIRKKNTHLLGQVQQFPPPPPTPPPALHHKDVSIAKYWFQHLLGKSENKNIVMEFLSHTYLRVCYCL